MKAEFIEICKGDHRFNDLRWVLLAKRKEEVLNGIHLVRFKESIAVATDGHRLHKSTIEDIPDGLYRVIKNNKSSIQILNVFDFDMSEYPDINKIWPQEDNMTNLCETTNVNCLYADAIRKIKDEDIYIDFKYFIDAVGNISSNLFYFEENTKRVLIKSKNRSALIMTITLIK